MNWLRCLRVNPFELFNEWKLFFFFSSLFVGKWKQIQFQGFVKKVMSKLLSQRNHHSYKKLHSQISKWMSIWPIFQFHEISFSWAILMVALTIMSFTCYLNLIYCDFQWIQMNYNCYTIYNDINISLYNIIVFLSYDSQSAQIHNKVDNIKDFLINNTVKKHWKSYLYTQYVKCIFHE